MSSAVNPFEFQLFKNALMSVADEMALTVHRTTYSPVLRDNLDYSTGFFDAQGRMVAQGFSLPAHLGSMPTALQAVLAHFEGDIHEGDVFCLNDPFDGGMHLPDIFIFRPIFVDGKLLAFAGSISHHTDVGGRVAGSNAADSTEVYQEGLRIPVLRMFDKGVRNDTIFAFVVANVRVPDKVMGDLRAQLSACYIAETSFKKLCVEYGTEKVEGMMVDLLDYTERMTRAEIAKLPDGTFSFTDYLDDDGIDIGEPVKLSVTITKKGDQILFDWSDCSDQVKGALNCSLSMTKSVSYCALISVFSGPTLNNDGLFRSIDVTAREGSIAVGVLPAATAARGLTSFRMLDAAFGAIAQMLPDQVFACSDGGNSNISIGGYYADKSPFIYADFTCSAWGGRPWADGLDGNSNILANMAGQSVEVTEAEQPVMIENYELIEDRGGVGQFRGGMPYRRTYRFLEKEGSLSVRSDRRDIRPYGLYGGGAGAASKNFIIRKGKEAELFPCKFSTMLYEGDILVHELPGAGGWGDPLARDVAMVAHDVYEQKVSPKAAYERYGVAFLEDGKTVDKEATVALRAKLKAERDWKETPLFQRDDWQSEQFTLLAASAAE